MYFLNEHIQTLGQRLESKVISYQHPAFLLVAPEKEQVITLTNKRWLVLRTPRTPEHNLLFLNLRSDQSALHHQPEAGFLKGEPVPLFHAGVHADKAVRILVC